MLHVIRTEGNCIKNLLNYDMRKIGAKDKS